MFRIVSFCCVVALFVVTGGCKCTPDGNGKTAPYAPGLWARGCDIGIGPSDPDDPSQQSWVQVLYAFDSAANTITLSISGGMPDATKTITIAKPITITQSGATWSRETTVDDAAPREVAIEFSPYFRIKIKEGEGSYYEKNFSYTYDGTAGPTYPELRWEPDSVISSSYNLLVIKWKGYTVQFKIQVS